MTNTGALANINDDEIIDRIANGEYQSHIAKELGIAPQNLHRRISRHPAYREALLCRNMANLDTSQEGICSGDDLARAREGFKAAAWRAERECPLEYGNKQEITIAFFPIGEALREARARADPDITPMAALGHTMPGNGGVSVLQDRET